MCLPSLRVAQLLVSHHILAYPVICLFSKLQVLKGLDPGTVEPLIQPLCIHHVKASDLLLLSGKTVRFPK